MQLPRQLAELGGAWLYRQNGWTVLGNKCKTLEPHVEACESSDEDVLGGVGLDGSGSVRRCFHRCDWTTLTKRGCTSRNFGRSVVARDVVYGGATCLDQQICASKG